MQRSTVVINRTKSGPKNWSKRFYMYMKRNWVFYVLLLPAFVHILIIRYFPMYGVQIAFRKYKARTGITGSEWVGLKYFEQFLNTPSFWQLIRNTLLLSGETLLFSFPVPIILALLLNEQRNLRLKKATQMITYIPHFVSTVAIIGIVDFLLNRQSGVLNSVLNVFGHESVNFMIKSEAFRPIYIISEIWQHAGWNAIIYLATLSGVDSEILEAARIDGANRFQVIRHINIPAIMPTIVTLLILSCGSLLTVGFEKVYLLQNDAILDVSEIISTYTYKMGILNGQFSYTTAIDLFNNVINCIILFSVNAISKKISGNGL